jgi:hypothetical protein
MDGEDREDGLNEREEKWKKSPKFGRKRPNFPTPIYP